MPAQRNLVLALLLATVPAATLRAQSAASAVDTVLGSRGASAGTLRWDDDRKDVPWRSYNEVTKGAEVRAGLFTLYLKRDRTYLSLSPSQLDRDFLLVTQLSQGIGELGLDGGASIRSDLVRFHRAADRIELWVVNARFAATPRTPAARAVASSFGHSVAQSFPIATVRDTSEILVDVGPFLLSDWADLASWFQGLASQRKVGGSVTLDRDRSSITGLRAFPANLEAEARLTYGSSRNLGLETVPDYRWIPVGVHYSLLDLPAVPMRPRLADDRVGYFVSAVKDFSRDTADGFFVRYVNRWRLEKRDPAAALSPPLHPITYYIDRTVPLEWRPYVRAGILEWNKAFGESGYQGAIQVLDAPDDTLWSAEDARYSTVRWTADTRAIYAIGPSNVDPRTGEILNADILISAQWIQTWRGESGEYLGPQAAVGAVLAEDSLLPGPGGAAARCSFGAGLARAGVLTRALLAARGDVPAGGAAPREFIGQAIKALVMHEVGHTLGLRHNFRGSAGAAADGIGVSVMDYSPPALSPDPRLQGDYFASTVGSYDRWAIRYGYEASGPLAGSEPATRTAPGGSGGGPGAWTPETESNALRAIASEASDPTHLYATDEDAGFGGAGVDPTVSRYDQTDDPLAWARGRVRLINGLFDSLETRMVAPGQSYARLRASFADLLTDRWYALLVTTKYLGGATTSRDHRGDPAARPAFVAVPAERQREALAFLTEEGFGEQAYRFRPELLSRLAPDRWSHWGSASESRIDFPLHDWALAQEGSILAQLLDPAVLSRIRETELRVAPDTQAFALPELFATLGRDIWAEVTARPGQPRNVSSVRRDLQRLYLNRLIGLVVNPAPGTPEDARTLARMTLTDLAGQLDRALARPSTELDLYTRAHLVDSRERIARALDAPILQAAGPVR